MNDSTAAAQTHPIAVPTSSTLLLGGSTQNKNGIKDIGIDKHKLNTPGQTPFLTEPRRDESQQVDSERCPSAVRRNTAASAQVSESSENDPSRFFHSN
ncbi:MAG: hypothetical protein EA424_21075 [Planctomycetaceae bacterium]|nr:MAG: hypothetical protein EA424_21075 [Planctomycetaceae bacterium]